MAKAEQETRAYAKADDKMLEQAQTMRTLFETDKADFTTLYPYLADPFSADWQSDIDAAQALPIADDELAELKVKTEDVELQLEAARALYQTLASYVKLLFPDSKARQDIFGLNKYEKMRQSQTKMYDLMQLAYRRASSADYQTDLVALGFGLTDIGDLSSVAQELYDMNDAQEAFKQNIRVLSEDRVEAYNKVWGSMVAVSNASKQVYAADYAKQQQYLLYPEGEGGLPGKVQNMAYDLPTRTVSWDAEFYSDTYQLERKFHTDPEWTVVYEGADTSVVNDPVTPGVWYFRCRGHNEEGYGSWSDELTVIMPT